MIGNDTFSTWTPTFYFGKGFGDLPDRLPFLKPFAITGTLGSGIPTNSGTQSDPNPNTLEWGLALEYSVIYLQEHVKDIGLKAPFNRLIPLVEFAMSTPLNRGVDKLITGTINPGVICSGQYFQLDRSVECGLADCFASRIETRQIQSRVARRLSRHSCHNRKLHV